MQAQQQQKPLCERAVVGDKVRVGAQRTAIYGDAGCGKTHLLSEFENAFFIGVENGSTGFSPAARVKFFAWPEQPDTPVTPRTLHDFRRLLERFRTEVNVLPKGGHHKPYPSLAIDSISGIEDLIHAEVCRQAGAKHMEDAEFGPKLWAATIPMWKAVLLDLDRIRAEGVNVWLVGHADEETVATRGGDTYKRKTLRVKGTGKLVADIRGVIMQWLDNLWFLCVDVRVEAGGRGKRTTASVGGRILLTQPGSFRGGGSYEAKSRITVPERLAATQEDIRRALFEGVKRPLERARQELEEVLKQLPQEQADAIREDLKAKPESALQASRMMERTLARAKALLAAAEDDVAATDATTEEQPAAPPSEEPAATVSAITSEGDVP